VLSWGNIGFNTIIIIVLRAIGKKHRERRY